MAVDTRTSARSDAVDGAGADEGGAAGEARNRPSSRTHALHARPRRAPRVRGHRCPALPRRPELDPRWVHGRRRLLRDQRLPHHVAAARRAQEPRPRRPRPVLPAPGPPPAPRAVPRARGRRRSSPSCSCPTRSRSCAATSSPRSCTRTNWWQIFRNVSYFEASGRPPMLQHLWSLAVEEQFYLIWPLLLAGMLKLWHGRRRPMLLATLAMITRLHRVDDRAVDQPGLPDRPGPVARLLRHRHAGVHAAHRRGARDGLGAVAALASARRRAVGCCSTSLGVVGLARARRACSSRSASSPRTSYRGGFVVCSLLSALVIAVTVHPGGGPEPLLPRPQTDALDRRAVLRDLPVALARLHDHAARSWTSASPGTPNLLLRLSVTVALAELSYRYVEQPIRQGALGRWFKSMRAATGSERVRMGIASMATAGGAVPRRRPGRDRPGERPARGGPARSRRRGGRIVRPRCPRRRRRRHLRSRCPERFRRP